MWYRWQMAVSRRAKDSGIEARRLLPARAAAFLLFFHIKDLLVSVFFRKFAREKYKYNKEVKVEVKMEVKMEVKR